MCRTDRGLGRGSTQISDYCGLVTSVYRQFCRMVDDVGSIRIVLLAGFNSGEGHNTNMFHVSCQYKTAQLDEMLCICCCTAILACTS